MVVSPLIRIGFPDLRIIASSNLLFGVSETAANFSSVFLTSISSTKSAKRGCVTIRIYFPGTIFFKWYVPSSATLAKHTNKVSLVVNKATTAFLRLIRVLVSLTMPLTFTFWEKAD